MVKVELIIGKVVSINTSEKRGKKSPVNGKVRFIENHGIQGDFHAGATHRQISLLNEKHFNQMKERLFTLKYGDFGENIVCSNIRLETAGLGSTLRLGEDIELSITQIGKECHTPCQIYHSVGDCIMPKNGLFCRVIQGGSLKTGDTIRFTKHIDGSCLQGVVLVISDSCYIGARSDTAGKAVAEILKKDLKSHVFGFELLPDKKEYIIKKLRKYSSIKGIDLILTVGGTGFSLSDVTPEATREVVERLTPGLNEAMRTASHKVTPMSMLSRGVSGIRNRTLIVNLPGSEKAARENLNAIVPALSHGLLKLRGDQTPCEELLESKAL
jgi:molybdenum cofactor synthesis domain-containing protein